MRCQVLKQFKRRGEIQSPGSIIDMPEEMLLKLAGYIQAIATADSYLKPPEVYLEGHIWHNWHLTPIPSQADTQWRSCRCCKGVDYWLSIHGLTICRKCHPPAPGAEQHLHGATQ